VKRFGPYLLDPVNQILAEGIRRIELSPKTFGVLHHLVENRGRLLRHEELLAAVWPNTFVQPEILKTHIRMLRRALGDDASAPRFIETRARLGYRFVAEVQTETPHPVEPAPHGRPALPGRAAPLARLCEALDATREGARRMIFVTGEAGIGKTALLEGFAEACGAQDLWLGFGRGRPFGAAEPLQPLLDIIGGWCREPRGAGIRRLLALHAPSCRGLIAAALGPAGAERRRAGEATAARGLREIADLLEAMAELRPVVLLLDDLHWMDEASLALLSALARRPGRRRILIVASARAAAQAPLRGVMLDLLVHRAAEELPLPTLTEAEIAQWLAQEGGLPPDGLVALLHQYSDGNPMLAGAVLDHLREAGLVRHRAGEAWRLAPIAATEVRAAPRVHQMLDLLMDELDAEECQVMEAASVAGRMLCSWAIQVLLDLSATKAEDLCRALCRRGLLRETGQRTVLPDGTVSPRFVFVHPLFRDILHARQGATRRAHWHRILGERVEANWGARAPILAAELAYRFREGQDWQRAILYGRPAA
jgi:DNA-binding winged helix-turn-helix (wHTH) protein